MSTVERMLAASEAAAMLGVSVAAVTKAARKGRIEAIGGGLRGRRPSWMFTRAAVERYAASVAVGSERTCPVCGETFVREHGGRLYCSERRAQLAFTRRKRGLPPDRNTYRRRCPVCDADFDATDAKRIYCSTRCRVEAFYRRRGITQAQYLAPIYRRRRAAGLCPCGKEPVTGGKQCTACRERGREASRERYRRKVAGTGRAA